MSATVERIDGAKGDADLLLFSDMHLGADLKREELLRFGSFEELCRNDSLDRELGAMLDHYAAKVSPGGRWRLVLAGDVIDFIGINLTPADLREFSPFEMNEDEVRYGLEPGPERCAWMMELVLRRHPHFFARLGAFLSAGHELVVVRGNHDAALFWPEVQAAFRAGLGAASHRVLFEDWFYLEPGRVYVEHGHAHDELCADPGGRLVRSDRPDRLTQPVSTLMLRYFGNRFPSMDMDTVDTWSIVDFFRWAFLVENPRRIAVAGLQTIGLLLLPFVRKAVRRGRQARIREERQAAPALVDHDDDDSDSEDERNLASRAMLKVAQGAHEAEKLAVGLARLVRRTARFGALGILRLLHLDRAAAVGGGIVLSASFGASSAPFAVKTLTIAVLLGIALFVERKFAATRQVAIGPKLRTAAEELAKLANVPLIVMGHSHKAVDTMLGDGTTRYVNLGSWLGASRPDAKDCPGFPHLVIRGEKAEFLRWQRPTKTALHVVAAIAA